MSWISFWDLLVLLFHVIVGYCFKKVVNVELRWTHHQLLVRKPPDQFSARKVGDSGVAVVALDGTLRSDGVQGVQKLARITDRALGPASLNNGTNPDAFGTWKILSLRIASADLIRTENGGC